MTVFRQVIEIFSEHFSIYGQKLIKIVIIVSIVSLTACVNTVNDVSPPPITTESMTISGENSLVWLVEPTLPYELIYYCGNEDVFTDGLSGSGIDIKTGEESDKVCWGHGGFRGIFLYDESKDLFGMAGGAEGESNFEMYPAGEFGLKFPDLVNQVHICYGVDSTMVTTIEESGYNSYEYNEALTGKCAVSYGNKLVTDFIYDGGETWGTRRFNTIVAIQKNGKWGIIDKDGSVIVPFILDHAISIDNTTAFAKYNGKYGILSVSVTE